MDRSLLLVGQEVVIHLNGRPASAGVVTRIGRTLAYISEVYGPENDRRIRSRPQAYNIETQKLNNSQYSGYFFRTREQEELVSREVQVGETLRQFGIIIESRSGWTLEQLEALLESVTQIRA